MTAASVATARRARSPRRLATAVAAASVAVSLVVAVPAAYSGAATRSPAVAPHFKNPTPIWFGAVLALTGPFAGFETPNLQGLETGIAVINRRGGLLGHPVKLAYEDDQSDFTKVVPAIQALLQQHSYAYIEPEVIGAFQQAMLPYLNHYKIISIEPTSGPGLFVKANPYNFEAYPSSGQVKATAVALGKLAGGPKKVKVAIINDGVSSNTLLTSEERTAVVAAGGKVVYTTSVSPSATDVSVQVADAKHAGANTLVSQSGSSTCLAVADGVQTEGWTAVKMLAPPACVGSAVMEAIPKSVASRYFALGQRAYLRDAATGGPGPQYKNWLPLLEKTGKIQDLAISSDTSDITSIMAWAITKAHTTATAGVLKRLQSLSTTSLPGGTLLALPNPRWTASNHTFSNASLKNFWALLKPGTPKDGTYNGETLKV